MYQYLRSVGFSKYIKMQEIEKLLDQIEKDYFFSAERYADSNDEMHVEIRAEVYEETGVCISGIIDESGKFRRQGFHPYHATELICSTLPVQIEKRMDGIHYEVFLDDGRVGVTVIFMLDNTFEFLMQHDGETGTFDDAMTLLSGLSIYGKVLLPSSTPVQQKKPDVNYVNVADELRAGNIEMLEQMAIEEMGVIINVSKRLKSEDLYSVVDTEFMPLGAECDVYQILGIIDEVEEIKNSITGEKLYKMDVSVNGLTIDLVINEVDLEGEPLKGRRFKGEVWLQGRLDF